MVERRTLRWLVLVAPVLLIVACLGDPTPRTGDLRGTPMVRPLPKPDFVLDDTQGRPFQFVAETEGLVTLLFFGYTFCPDVCPIHMATLGAALDELPPEVTSRIRVVFVSGDADRDSPERIREWLDNYSSSFVGLGGTLDQVNAVLAELMLPGFVIGPRESEAEDEYEVGHPAAILAFTPDNLAHIRYPFGMRRADWLHDLPILTGMAGSVPATRRP